MDSLGCLFLSFSIECLHALNITGEIIGRAGLEHRESEDDWWLEMGYMIGIGGVVTFKKAALADIVKDIPLDMIVLETDSPYLAPTPFRGKRNESTYCKIVAEKIAEIKNITLQEVATTTTKNAKRLFRLE